MSTFLAIGLEESFIETSTFEMLVMNGEVFLSLLSSAGQTVLAEAVALAPTEKTYLNCVKRLEKTCSRELARACLDTVLLREKARTKFSRAERMYFTREALEQASGETIAKYRARKFAQFSHVADFACGVGGDTLALARQNTVVAVDCDPLRLALARENARVHDVLANVEFHEADLTCWPFPAVDAVFFDPARRIQGRRVLSIHQYQPPLSLLSNWLTHTPALAVKIAPGVSRSELDTFACEQEFLSVDGELKECVLWFGPLCSTQRRATLLPDGATMTGEEFAGPVEQSLPLDYLYEPDPSILRAGLVTNLAQQIAARQLDAEIAYLTARNWTATPFATAYRIEAGFPFHLKRLREALRSLGVGQVVIKKRGSPIDPNTLLKQLKLSGTESRFLFLTRVAGEHYVLIASRIDNKPEAHR